MKAFEDNVLKHQNTLANMKRLWHKIIMWILFSLVLALLVLHLFNLDFVVIDNITILLIVLLVMILFIPYLKKIKWGDFEAEINSEEVTKVEKEIKKLPEIKKEVYLYPEDRQISEEINLVLESDHILALAKLRIELEKILNQILSKVKDAPKKLSIGQLVRILEKDKLLDGSHISPIREVIDLCNRAIHGEEVKERDARLIVEIGLNLLNRLYSDYYNIVMKPTKQSTVSAKERDEYSNAKYEVITIIPTVKTPKKNRYIFTQEELDDFLENYTGHAEFLVSVKKI